MNLVNRTLGCVAIGFTCGMSSGVAQGQSPGAGESPFRDAPAPQAEAAEKSILTGVIKDHANVATTASATSADFCQCIGGALASNSETVKLIERALKAPLHSGGLDYVEQPLTDVLNQLQEEYGIPIQIDRPALDGAGIPSDQPLSVNIHNVSLGAALRLVLKTINLTYIIQDEVMLITTPQEADRRLRICVYNVGGVIGNSEPKLDSLIDMLQSCVATETWAKNGGGQAEIRAIKPEILVISQTAAVHEEIRELLVTIRNARGNAAPAAHQEAAHEHAAAEEVVTRSYTLQLNPTDDIDTMRSQVRELITGALPDEVWSGRLGDGQAVMLTVFHDRVVVRQTPGVHEKVAKILSDSGVAAPAAGGPVGAPFGGSGGRFGGGRDDGAGGQGGGFFSRGLENERAPAQNEGTRSQNPFQ